MKTIWEKDAQDELLARAEKLRPDAPALWGKLNCPRMLTHVTDGLRMAMGSLKVTTKNSPLRFAPIRYLIIYVFPLPKGAPAAPELLARAPEEWERELADFKQVFAQLVADNQQTDGQQVVQTGGQFQGLDVKQIHQGEFGTDLVQLFNQGEKGEQAKQGNQHHGAGAIDFGSEIAACGAHENRAQERRG